MRPPVAIVVVFLALAGAATAEDSPYDFRSAPEYAALSELDRGKLEQVHRDLVLLWGAIDMYAEDHNGAALPSLEALVPRYLRELPRDPFATRESAAQEAPQGKRTSLGGWGYRYVPTGSSRAFVISSVGLPRFPYLAAKGNHGLYRAKGHWAGGDLDVPFKTQSLNQRPLEFLEKRGRLRGQKRGVTKDEPSSTSEGEAK